MDHRTLFNDKADLYERARPLYPGELFQFLDQQCEAKQLAWDSACGNGQAALGLAQFFDSVYATDISAAQLANAKTHPRISYQQSPSEQSSLADTSCDLVCVAQALHWFDYRLFWPEVKRVLKPGGVFSAWGYCWPHITPAIDAQIQEAVLDVVESYWAPQNQLIWDHYRTIDFPFEKLEAPEFRMSVDWDLNEFYELLHTFSATRRCMDDIGDDFFSKARARTAKLWGDSSEKRPIEFDFIFYAGRHEP